MRRVRVAVSLSTSRPRRGGRVSFSGTIRPPKPGMTVKIQRRGDDGVFRTSATTTVQGSTPDAGTYARSVTIRRSGTYRVSLVTDGTHYNGVSVAAHHHGALSGAVALRKKNSRSTGRLPQGASAARV